MILIPEIDTVVILVPRTGSGTLKHAVQARYPRSMLIYRHMEADGIPAGYEHWRKVGVIRHPVDRLWSLYNFIGSHDFKNHTAEYRTYQKESVQLPFSDWIVRNRTVFTDPHDVNHPMAFYPQHNVRHAVPETRKSQWVYLRPDLGTQLYVFENLQRLEKELDVPLSATVTRNATLKGEMPALTPAAEAHLRKFFMWDFENWFATS